MTDKQNELLLTERQIKAYCRIVDDYGYIVTWEKIGDLLEAQLAKAKPIIEKQERDLLLSEELLEVGRKAIEDVLVEWRDNRLSEFTRGNGLVIREKDGKDSTIIRFGPETALKIGIKAMFGQALKAVQNIMLRFRGQDNGSVKSQIGGE